MRRWQELICGGEISLGCGGGGPAELPSELTASYFGVGLANQAPHDSNVCIRSSRLSLQEGC
jgi:hypothetical protein